MSLAPTIEESAWLAEEKTLWKKITSLSGQVMFWVDSFV
jgi:hypothetical protein